MSQVFFFFFFFFCGGVGSRLISKYVCLKIHVLGNNALFLSFFLSLSLSLSLSIALSLSLSPLRFPSLSQGDM